MMDVEIFPEPLTGVRFAVLTLAVGRSSSLIAYHVTEVVE
jgi:hypothetical protein